ncbi:MAG: dynamin family protein [Deltaproteobacteria bacterium]|jgi:GTPase SAR1 family protein|nr:dynamin family protein [Deltaproteobacteria bacterium]
MKDEKAAKTLIKKLDKLLRGRMAPIYKRYGVSMQGVLTPLMWKPLVLVIGNYSSGKSTFINELLDMPVQRTGQAPTDDCFTILTSPEEGESEEEVPGGTIVNDERLPFAPLRPFGEKLFAHLRLKKVNSPILEKYAIIDTPGMLDSVTEKDRGYDYLGVIGELARLADLIILMFDPHKAGTIMETYQAIRSTLPGSTGEDRVLYVLNRIDECDNVPDLVRSYGTLCWNLSQMTGRKDIPRIYLTFAAKEGDSPPQGVESWISERDELKRAVETAPTMRINHVFQEAERGVRELDLQAEALAAFKNGFGVRTQKVLKVGMLISLLVFFFGDIILKLAFGLPEKTILGSLFSGPFDDRLFILPSLAALLILAFTGVVINNFIFPRYKKNVLEDLESLIPFETAYKRDLWQRVRDRVSNSIEESGFKQLWISHIWYRKRLKKVLDKDIGRLKSNM